MKEFKMIVLIAVSLCASALGFYVGVQEIRWANSARQDLAHIKNEYAVHCANEGTHCTEMGNAKVDAHTGTASVDTKGAQLRQDIQAIKKGIENENGGGGLCIIAGICALILALALSYCIYDAQRERRKQEADAQKDPLLEARTRKDELRVRIDALASEEAKLDEEIHALEREREPRGYREAARIAPDVPPQTAEAEPLETTPEDSQPLPKPRAAAYLRIG